MTISVWRYSHLALAVSSFLFVTLAAITGVILGFEPVAQKLQPYRSETVSQVSVAQTLPVLTKKYSDITEITVDHNQFVALIGADESGDMVDIYVDPSTGKKLGTVAKKNVFFQWVTDLHRSLFLHEAGRFFIGLTSFLLLLISISGTILVIQRQRGWKTFFTRIVRDNFAQYYHVLFGRLWLIPIIIISLSGTILSLVRFNIIPETKVSHKVDFEAIQSAPKKEFADFAIFKSIPLSQVRSIEFPFSEDPEDYFTIKLKDRELTVNQITGDVLTEAKYPFSNLLSNLSLDLHTGRKSAIWAIVLAIASINILFFIYSGFAIMFQRRAGVIKNKFKAVDSKFVILVGSENGSSMRFAKAIHQKIIAAGQTSYIAELNSYKVFPKAEHFVILTATYGTGEPPTNAAKFSKLLAKHPQLQKIHFSVIGFGSHVYPDFCQFAFDVNNLLSHQPWAVPLVEIHTVNDKSLGEFGFWGEVWSQKTGIALDFTQEELHIQPQQMEKMLVTAKESMMPADPTFIIRLQPKKRLAFVSGDLLAIYPAKDHRERLYSMGKMDKEIQLSVKLHEGGLGSSYLHNLKPGDELEARIVSNNHFYFPSKTSAVIMISNGTGIAPFLGMINENRNKVECRLYCGFRVAASFKLYKSALEKAVQQKQLSQLHVAYSRQAEKQYVSQLVARDAEGIANALAQGATIMLCGSLSMQKDVIEVLEEVCKHKHQKGISYYQSHGQVLMDCY